MNPIGKQMNQPNKVPRTNSNYVSYGPQAHIHYIQPQHHMYCNSAYDAKQRMNCYPSESPLDKKQGQQQRVPQTVAQKKKPELYINKIENNYY